MKAAVIALFISALGVSGAVPTTLQHPRSATDATRAVLFEDSALPEPDGFAVLAGGLVAMMLIRRRR